MRNPDQGIDARRTGGGLGAQPQLKGVGGRASFNYTRHVATPALLPTTVVGSYPQPDWLVDRANLSNRHPPRVRAREIWRVDAQPETNGLPAGTYELSHDLRRGTWSLFRVWD